MDVYQSLPTPKYSLRMDKWQMTKTKMIKSNVYHINSLIVNVGFVMLVNWSTS